MEARDRSLWTLLKTDLVATAHKLLWWNSGVSTFRHFGLVWFLAFQAGWLLRNQISQIPIAGMFPLCAKCLSTIANDPRGITPCDTSSHLRSPWHRGLITQVGMVWLAAICILYPSPSQSYLTCNPFGSWKELAVMQNMLHFDTITPYFMVWMALQVSVKW